MLRVALCDDQDSAITKYAKLISQIAAKNHLEIELSCFHSGESLLFHYLEKPDQVDIVYLDILMDHTDGMETARRLRACKCGAHIVFLTSCEEYVYEAFDVNAAHYLLKEETGAEKFETVFLKAAERSLQKEDERFAFEFDGALSVIPMDEISHFEIWNKYVTVHYGAGKTAKFAATMEQLQEKLAGKDFARVHRSFLVSLAHIATFQRQSLRLKNGAEVPIGITYVQSLKRTFSDYIAGMNLYAFTKIAKNGGRI